MELKEMRFRPKVDTHDYEFKTKHIRQFLEEGNKVKVFVMFRGCEMARTEFGRKLLDRVCEDMADMATVEVFPKQEGRRMNMVLAPLPAVVKKAAQSRLERANDRQRKKAIAAGQLDPSRSDADTQPLEESAEASTADSPAEAASSE
ncbi:MAG: translation initiation factor IF-3, partial [Candidatus Zixiibacteriota bacterium]